MNGVAPGVAHRLLPVLVWIGIAAACATPAPPASVAPAPEPTRPAGLPPIPARSGPLEIRVVYPSEGARITASDSTFVFGSVGTGGAALRINGAPVEVAPNGAFLAFLPVPRDGVYTLVAAADGVNAQARRVVRPPAAPVAPAPESPFEVGGTDPALDAGIVGYAPPRVGVAHTERPDGRVIGQAAPGPGNPYEWFFPEGTRFTISGARAGEYRVRLSDDRSVWVDTAEVRLLPPGTPPVRGSVGAVRLDPQPGYVEVRLATTERLPFRVDETERGLDIRVFGATGRTNWLYYGAMDPLIRFADWEQSSDEVYRLHVELAERPWGYQSFWDARGNLTVRVRRPPRLDPEDPLRGAYIGVDAGHPPGGAIGPTGLTEAEANLAIARRLTRLLREAGARVLETRPDTAAVALGERPLLAADSNVHLLVSVHNNAFPDGVNPFTHNGTSVFYNHLHSLGLARHLQGELLREFGLRDLGIARADLALARPTWMPSALSETMFLMIPRQESALRDPEVQERIARAHLRGIRAFLRERAAEQEEARR